LLVCWVRVLSKFELPLQGLTILKNMKVFIAYSHEDRKFAKDLESFLKESGTQVIDPLEDIRPGNNVFATINRGVEDSDLILLFFSSNSSENEIFSIELDLITSKIVNNFNKRVIPILRDKHIKLPAFIRQFQALTLYSSIDDENSFKLIRDLIFSQSDLEINKQNIEAESSFIETKGNILKLEEEEYKEEAKNKASALTAGITVVILSLLNVALIAMFLISKGLESVSYASNINTRTVLTPFLILIIGITLAFGIGLGIIISLIINNRIRK
jgi:hypothetical protein